MIAHHFLCDAWSAAQCWKCIDITYFPRELQTPGLDATATTRAAANEGVSPLRVDPVEMTGVFGGGRSANAGSLRE